MDKLRRQRVKDAKILVLQVQRRWKAGKDISKDLERIEKLLREATSPSALPEELDEIYGT